jgi:hypothetical protein
MVDEIVMLVGVRVGVIVWVGVSVAPQILIVLFLIYLFDNIIQLISLRSLWYYGGW